MSTNYYLHRDPQHCGECGKPGRDAEIHIGKRSGGWVFTWQGFNGGDVPEAMSGLFDEATWRDFLTREIAEGAKIKDEYGQVYELAEFMVGIVAAQRGLKRQSVEYPDSHKAPVGPDEVSYGEWF
jgi:hypothetical protein